MSTEEQPAVGSNSLQIILGAGMSAAFHPFVYAKTLIQIGYEPVQPVLTKNVFGRPVLTYPNVFKYLGYIKKEDGFFGLYRGLSVRIVQNILGSVVTTAVNEHLHKHTAKTPKETDLQVEAKKKPRGDLHVLLHDTTLETISRCAGIVVTQPLYVLMVRSMAQFVGKETKYDSLLSGIIHIYRDDGILGFFAGLMPRLVGEVITIWMANLLNYTITRYVLPKDAQIKELPTYTSAVCAMMVSQFCYPFYLITTVMAVNDSGLLAGSLPYSPTYASWRDCWTSLTQQGQLKRGASFFWRYYQGPTTRSSDGTLMVAAKSTAPKLK